MKPKLILLRLAALAAAAVFLLKAPPVIEEQLDRNFYGEWVKTEPSEWKGVIRVWNVYTDRRFDPDALAKAAKKYEKKHRGAYISYYTLPMDSVEGMIARKGEPDVWIFPEGVMTSGEEDVVITMPKPAGENVITEDFEFDVADPDKAEILEDNTIRIIVTVKAEGEKGECAKAFSDLLYELNDTSG